MLRISLISIICLLSFGVVAQKKVKERPKNFIAPLSYDNEATYLASIKREQDGSGRPWFVISDRNNNPVYSKKEASDANKVATLDFKDIVYVVDSDKDWLKVIKADLSNLKIQSISEQLGWISKTNVMLSADCLLDQQSRIEQKGLILNKIDDYARISKNNLRTIAKIYDGPKSSNELPPLNVFEFYFVYKVHYQNDRAIRYLICKANDLSTIEGNIEKNLLGWIDARRLELWRTRVSLEPNFDESAFNERKNNPQYRAQGYKTQLTANMMSKGASDKVPLVWDNDPAVVKQYNLAKTFGRRRHKGNVIRFPMLGFGSNNNEGVFRSGAIMRLSSESFGKYLKIEEDKLEENTFKEFKEGGNYNVTKYENYNIFFLIEGTQDMQPYKSRIIDAISSANMKPKNSKAKVRYGALVYRDTPEESSGKVISRIAELSTDIDDVMRTIDQEEFKSWHDNDPYTSLYYAFEQALLKGGFDENHTNVMVVIGNNSDFRNDPVRKMTASGKYNIKQEYIRDKISELYLHTLFIQCGSNTLSSSAFSRQMRSLVEVTATNMDFIREETLAKIGQGMSYKQFELDEVSGAKGQLHLTYAPIVSSISYTGQGQDMNQQEIKGQIEDGLDRINQRVKSAFDNFNEVVVEGKGMVSSLDVSSGEWSTDMGDLAYRVYKKSKMSFDELKKILSEKYQLFSPVYLVKQYQGAQNKTYSYTAFMTQKDLKRYTQRLEDLKRAYDGVDDEQRKNLFNAFKEMIESLTGESLSYKALDNYDTSMLNRLMQGIAMEGLEVDLERRFKVGEILDSKKMPPTKLKEIMKGILVKLDELLKIERQGKDYEFAYYNSLTNDANLYFWIPLDMLLI